MGIQRTITELAHQAVADTAAVRRLAAVLEQQLRTGHGYTLQRAMHAMPASPARRLLTELIEHSATRVPVADSHASARLFAIGLSLPGDADYLVHPLRQRTLLTTLIDRLPESGLVLLDSLLPLPLAGHLPIPTVWQITQQCVTAATASPTLAGRPDALVQRPSTPHTGRWCMVGLLRGNDNQSLPLLREALPGCFAGGRRQPDVSPALDFFDLLRHERLRAGPLAVLEDLLGILHQHRIGMAELGVIVYRQLPDELRLAVFHLPTGTAMAGIRRSLEDIPGFPAQPHVAAEVFSRAGFGLVRLMPDQPAGQPFLTLADLAPRRL